MAKEKPVQQITEKTTVPLSVVAAIVVCVIAAATWAITMEIRVDSAAGSRWTLKNQHDWCELLQANNPDLNIPIPDEHDH